jgi:hypothetical protein
MIWLLLACNPPLPVDTTEPVPVDFSLTMSNISAPGAIVASDESVHDIKLAPGLVIVHDPAFELLVEGQAIGMEGLEALAEDGNPLDLQSTLAGDERVDQALFVPPLDDVTYEASPILPGGSGTVSFSATTDRELTVVSMYGESDDIVVALLGVPLVPGPLIPVMYDVGTEINEESGLGPNQAPRQASPGDGLTEGGVVTVVNGTDSGGFPYPGITEFVRIELAQP